MQPINKRKKPFYVERGDIYLTNLGKEEDVIGSEQFGVRPTVVTSSNFLNRRSPTVIVAAITSELKKTGMDSHYILPDLPSLPKSSMVLGEQRFTIDKQRLLKYCCKMDKVPVYCWLHRFGICCDFCHLLIRSWYIGILNVL